MPGNDEVKLVRDALLDEAAKWRKLSDDMGTVKAGLGDLALYVSAFFAGDAVTAQMGKGAYDPVLTLVQKLAGEAETEFDQIAEALKRAHDDYDAVEGKNATDLSKIYGN
ncbi:hypothetical protein [Actinoplanes sp. NPDC049265]|uniref:hypothetical protein n=1 Tax=Actinoplanes sp. NPDC049265 TaxID=3363902 RepID=UPI003723CF39